MIIRVLFVCLGNICRSPTAHGVFVKQVADAGLSESIHVDSAGTSSGHKGSLPDVRSREEALARGYDLSFIRSRQVLLDDYRKQDLILAMDQENLETLRSQCPEEFQQKLGLFLAFADNVDVREVPDPYYGGDENFAKVLSLIEDGGIALLKHLQKNHIP
ncbi:MAG: low molecular weight protein-tyrosine-phosphatase [Candidatus Endonucleobacter bathymodioli]|uniref:protein-tyrosine-phosphatase n=1 Tax=Candidatus Endonucleibacter bathymodioli TaxID=539814 RepID=A0AA90NRF9_9GAMM|nr:low molecular weight protein-tyrosine-phosphatase [Candidatus Endonucleobacter bathymodioli]